jgi:hypothetical protein
VAEDVVDVFSVSVGVVLIAVPVEGWVSVLYVVFDVCRDGSEPNDEEIQQPRGRDVAP